MYEAQSLQMKLRVDTGKSCHRKAAILSMFSASDGMHDERHSVCGLGVFRWSGWQPYIVIRRVTKSFQSIKESTPIIAKAVTPLLKEKGRIVGGRWRKTGPTGTNCRKASLGREPTLLFQRTSITRSASFNAASSSAGKGGNAALMRRRQSSECRRCAQSRARQWKSLPQLEHMPSSA